MSSQNSMPNGMYDHVCTGAQFSGENVPSF